MKKNVKENKIKNKLMSMISPVQSHHHEGSPMGNEVKLRWEGFVEDVGLSLEWKSEGEMDAESEDDEKDGLTSEWGE